jgi:RNA polymerase Rpb5, N-terminal domain.
MLKRCHCWCLVVVPSTTRNVARTRKFSENVCGFRSFKFLRQVFFMGDVDESAKLWKVNRTIHELVKDRVSYTELQLYTSSYGVVLTQGFQVSDDEIHMDLQAFKDLYANSVGMIE